MNTALREALEASLSDVYTITQSLDELADQVRNLDDLTEDQWNDLMASALNLRNSVAFTHAKRTTIVQDNES